MVVEKKKKATHKQQRVEETVSDNDAPSGIRERGTEAYEQAEQAVSDVYDKAAQAVGETYERAKIYSRKNPDKAILITLGIGVGLGFLMGASSRRSRRGRFAQPVVNALSEIALEFFR